MRRDDVRWAQDRAEAQAEKAMDRDTCMRLYGDAYAVKRDGITYGWYPTPELARAAARGDPA